MAVQTLSTLILVASIGLVGVQLWHTRKRLLRGDSVFPPLFASTLVFALAIALILILGLSPLHILWLLPLSAVIGTFILFFPMGVAGVFACMSLLVSIRPDRHTGPRS